MGGGATGYPVMQRDASWASVWNIQLGQGRIELCHMSVHGKCAILYRERTKAHFVDNIEKIILLVKVHVQQFNNFKYHHIELLFPLQLMSIILQNFIQSVAGDNCTNLIIKSAMKYEHDNNFKGYITKT